MGLPGADTHGPPPDLARMRGCSTAHACKGCEAHGHRHARTRQHARRRTQGAGLHWGLPDAGVQRGCQDGVQGQGGVQDRSFEAEHATTRPEWVWRHVTPTPCTNGMSARKSLSCERVFGKQFREIIPADKGDEYRHEKQRRARMKAVAHDEFRSAIHHYQNLDI